MVEDIFKDLVRGSGIFFRGVPLGASRKDIQAVEGNDFDEVGGSLPHLEYFIETGDYEEIFLYYGFPPGRDQVTEQRCFLYGYPKLYWEDAGGSSPQELFQDLHAGTLDRHIPHLTALRERLVAHFTAQLGAPATDHEEAVFNQPHHQFQRYRWQGRDGQNLYLQSYWDDQREHSIRWVLSLLLS